MYEAKKRESGGTMYNVGDIIVYGEHGICRVAAVGPLDLGGPGGRLYYTLHPYYQPELVIYAPIDNERVVIRPPVTREQAEQIVSELPGVPELEIPDEKGREALFSQVQHGCDCRALAGMLKTLYRRRAQRQQKGRRATSVDERYFHAAEDQLYGELAFALGMNRDEAPEYIRTCLGQAN